MVSVAIWHKILTSGVLKMKMKEKLSSYAKDQLQVVAIGNQMYRWKYVK